jgi:biopolymer transport protein ExbB
MRSLLEARQYREAIEYSAADPSMVSGVIHAALAEASNGYPAMERAMEEAIDDQTSKNLRKIEYLNIIGNIAPMIGLFGTVFGMIKTFQAIVVAKGIPEPDKLAEGISIALVTTLWGLAIAIPALTVFATLRNRIEGLAAETALRAQALLGMFNPSATKTGAPGGSPAGATPPAAKPAAPPSPTPQPGQ